MQEMSIMMSGVFFQTRKDLQHEDQLYPLLFNNIVADILLIHLIDTVLQHA
jgi:hypothetical protein